MKNLILITILLSALPGLSQDSSSQSTNKIQRAYDYLTMAHKEELSIWKFKVLPITPLGGKASAQKSWITYDGTPLTISYERKVRSSENWKRNFSWQIEGKLLFWSADRKTVGNIDSFQFGSGNLPYTKNDYQVGRIVANAAISAELRYYYNMSRRMHRKHGRNNFSGNYFALKTTRNVLQIGTDVDRNYDQMFGGSTDQACHPFYDNLVAGCFGIQRRFLKYFFMDFQLGSAFRYGANTYRPNNRWRYEFPAGSITEDIEWAPRWVLMSNFRVGFAF